MTTSILIIAHNEEKHIAKCIKSALNQTEKATEIILIAHNCTDQTETIAKQYPIKVIPYHGPRGIAYARIEGLQHVSGDIILCTDGDSFVARNWCAVMKKTLVNNNILVGSYMKFSGNIFGWISNFFNKYRSVQEIEKIERWIWGPSFGFWGKDKEMVSEFYKKSIHLSETLELTRNPEDYWLALFMKQKGKLELTNKTYVVQNPKEQNFVEVMKRNAENVVNGNKIEAYFKEAYR